MLHKEKNRLNTQNNMKSYGLILNLQSGLCSSHSKKKGKKLTALSKNTFMRSMEETGGLLEGGYI